MTETKTETQEFGQLSEFTKRQVELFTGQGFELLRFGLDGGNHMIYIKYPSQNYFTEIFEAGMGNSNGGHQEATGKNVFQDSYHAPITIRSAGDDLMLSLESFPKFYFMKKVAEYDPHMLLGTKMSEDTIINLPKIEQALTYKYLKIPDSIRQIAYCLKTKEANPKYIIVDFPAYNFQYSNHRLTTVQNDIVTEYKFKNMLRYRDGGTTKITVEDQFGNEHLLFSPTAWPKKELADKWDDEELEKVTPEEQEHLVQLLGIKLASNKEEENN